MPNSGFRGFSNVQNINPKVLSYVLNGTPAGWTLTDLVPNGLYSLDGRFYSYNSSNNGGRASLLSPVLFGPTLQWLEITYGFRFYADVWTSRPRIDLYNNLNQSLAHMYANSASSQAPNGSYMYASKGSGQSSVAMAAGAYIGKMYADPSNLTCKVFDTTGTLVQNLDCTFTSGHTFSEIAKVYLEVYCSNNSAYNCTIHSLTIRYMD